MKVLQYRRRAPHWSPWTTIFWWTGVRFLVWLFFKLVYRLRVDGREHIPSRGPIIYVSNHQSHYDPPAIGSVVYDRPFTALARASLFNFRPFGWLIRQTGAIPLRRTGTSAQAFKISLGALKDGGCVLIFPEGTRTPDGTIQRFKAGMLLLARRSGAPVIPVAIEGAYDIWPIGRRRPRLRGRIAIRISSPIAAEDLLAVEPAEAMSLLRTKIDAMRQELRAALGKRSPG